MTHLIMHPLSCHSQREETTKVSEDSPHRPLSYHSQREDRVSTAAICIEERRSGTLQTTKVREDSPHHPLSCHSQREETTKASEDSPQRNLNAL